MTNKILEESILKYLDIGWSPFPVQISSFLNERKEVKKITIFPGEWKPYGTTERIKKSDIDKLWQGKEHVALATGKFAGITVIDVDTKEDILPSEFPRETYTVETNKGFHYYFKYNPEALQTQQTKDGIDIRNDGGCVYAPPTKYKLPDGSIAKYRIVKAVKLAEFPIEWYKKAFNVTTDEKGYVVRNTAFDWEEMSKGVPDGSRNITAIKMAGKLIKQFNPNEHIAAWELFRAWNETNDPKLEERIIRRTWSDIIRKDKGNHPERYKICTVVQNSDISENASTGKKPAGGVFGRIGQAEEFIKQQPVYYDERGLLWFWNFDKCCYEMKDEVALYNGIRKELSVDTVEGKARSEILAALKQVGREQAPKPKPKGWVQFMDVLVNPKTLKKVPAGPEYFLTNPIPWKLGKTEETPVIDKLLHEWVVKEGEQDESYVQSLYEYIAYALTDDLFMQRIIALTGGGSNGKGTFLKLIEKLVGIDSRVTIDLRKLSKNDFATSCLYKKLVAFAGEVHYNDLSNTNTLKMLAGEDAIDYEFKGKNGFTDENITTFYIATNSLPITNDKSLGFYRRWAITDFPNIFSINANVLGKIPDKEYENLCLKCLNILKGLYETRKFTNEGTYNEREVRYEERSNPIPSFIESCCEEQAGNKVKLQDFGKSLNIWLKRKNLRVMSIRDIGKVLRDLGYGVGKRDFPIGDGELSSATAILNLNLRPKTTETTETTVKSTQTPIRDLT